MLSVGLTLAGLAGLLITRLRIPLVLDLLSPWRAAPAAPGSEDQPCLPWPLMKNQFELDLVFAILAGLGLFLVIYYHRRLLPFLAKLEGMSLDRW
jgi:hypothetical protein